MNTIISITLTEAQVQQVTKEEHRWRSDYSEIALCSIEFIIRNLKRKIDATLPPKHKGRTRDGKRYTFIPASFRHVAEALLSVRSHASANNLPKPLNFLDVGCGIGNIMLIPYALYMSAHGIEYDQEVLKHALFPTFPSQRYVRASGIYHSDAQTFRHYDKYDVLYYYCPMCDGNLEVALEKKILTEMKEGAYLITFSGYTSVDSTKAFDYITHNVWRKRGQQ